MRDVYPPRSQELPFLPSHPRWFWPRQPPQQRLLAMRRQHLRAGLLIGGGSFCSPS